MSTVISPGLLHALLSLLQEVDFVGTASSQLGKELCSKFASKLIVWHLERTFPISLTSLQMPGVLLEIFFVLPWALVTICQRGQVKRPHEQMPRWQQTLQGKSEIPSSTSHSSSISNFNTCRKGHQVSQARRSSSNPVHLGVEECPLFSAPAPSPGQHLEIFWHRGRMV